MQCMAHLNPGRHDRWRADEWRVHVVLRGWAASGAARVVTEFVDTGDGEFVVIFLVLKHGRLGHAGIAEPVEYINVAGILGRILEHGVCESREHILNLA